MSLDSAQRAEQDRGFDLIADEIGQAATIALCAHTDPDGDALGSVLALAHAIETRWPGKEVACLTADDEEIPAIYRFLPGSERFVPAKSFEGTPDLFICVDLSAPHRLEDAEAVFDRSARKAVIDHHPGSTLESVVGVIRPSAAAAGIIVAELIDHLGIELDADMATCLFCAIVTDTGRFQYQNADGEAFSVASKLVEAGASPSDVALHVYQSDRLAYLYLESKVMGRIITFSDGRIAYSYATLADIKASGVAVSECDGLVDVVRRVAGAEVIMFLKQISENQVRGNLRSKSNLDISSVARALGGGGHQAASGFPFEGTIDDALETALPLLRTLVESGETA